MWRKILLKVNLNQAGSCLLLFSVSSFVLKLEMHLSYKSTGGFDYILVMSNFLGFFFFLGGGGVHCVCLLYGLSKNGNHFVLTFIKTLI